MKPRSFAFTVLLVVLVLVGPAAFAGPGPSRSGGNGSHGGDVLVAQFTGSMDNLVREIADLRPAECASSVDLARTLDEVEVYGKPVVFCGGREQDACSYRDEDGKRITEISRSRLIEIKNAPLYLNLVLHEYYVHLGLETTNRMLRSKACLDSLSASGKDLGKLMNQISPLTSLEEQLSDGRVGLTGATLSGEKVTISLAHPTDFPRCRARSPLRGGFPAMEGDCADTDHLPFAVIVQRGEDFGLRNTIAFESRISFRERLRGSYDIASGVYTLRARYENLDAWTSVANDAYFSPSNGKWILSLVSTDHETWKVELLGGGFPFEFTTIEMHPTLEMK